MIKVKGYRIELGEIEQALSRFPHLDEFCVVPVPDPQWGNRLFCYYSVLEGNAISSDEIIDFLSTLVPNYMIPYRFFKRKVLPKTSSGKIDRILLGREAGRAVFSKQ